jgi:hypothetical protein
MTNESCNIRLDIEIPPHYQISAKTVDILVFIVGEILLIAVVEAIPKDIVVGLLRGGINQMVDAIAAANGELKTLISAH